MIPRDVLAAVTRKAIEDHDGWDSPHWFTTLHWDGEKLTPGTVVCIMPDVGPDQYPQLMARTAAERLAESPADPPFAFLVQMEMFGLPEPGPQASPAERERYERARLTRTFYQQPDAVEAAVAWCADIHGRSWCAAERRSEPGVIHEAFYPPGRAPRGQIIRALLGVAYATGTKAHGLPGPQQAWN